MDPIEQALTLHAKIKQRLKAAVLAPEGIDPQSIRTDRTCEFGVWIYGPEGIQHAALPEFKALKDTHKRFHESAYVAMCLCCTGKRAEAEASVTTGEFQVLSEQMITRLLAMQSALRQLKPFVASRAAQAPGHAQPASPNELSKRREVD